MSSVGSCLAALLQSAEACLTLAASPQRSSATRMPAWPICWPAKNTSARRRSCSPRKTRRVPMQRTCWQPRLSL
ncbi:hypothetical protein DMC30DRAFT_392811 [Rhodotorula diobovata]|uniref:Secreted protein n=1 Tax=Rhodotorula diobovata TaxID=5288 RepID=A0A5C5FZI7_9BASI|nr:hypothetical protein DMC30DRAFT_392811 [Rhodotorula diobovata]